MTPVDPKGFFSRDYEPLVTVGSGEPLRFDCLNAGWRWDPDEVWPHPRRSGHPLHGPIEVRGACAGQTLLVHVDAVTPRPWGVTFGGKDRFHWTLDGEAWRLGERSVRSAPFLGVLGMPPPEPGKHSTIPPRRWGGNIDCRLLVAGTTLHLPIPVDGALLLAGDGHGAQGDGEVSGTAIECPLDSVQLRFEVKDGPELRMPIARTSDAWVAFGFDPDLDVAADLALQTMLDLMERGLGVGRNEALALASVAVDLVVTQVVNESKGVHAILRDEAIR